MITALSHAETNRGSRPGAVLICPALKPFDSKNWDDICHAFYQAPVLTFGQHWRKEAEERFRPGCVRFAWQKDRFLFFADLEQDHFMTTATGRNQPLWQLGDVFELFAGVRGHSGYIEYHTAPNGLVLQLSWPDSESAEVSATGGNLIPYLVTDDAAVCRVRATSGGWQVYGELPSSSLPGGRGLLRGQSWSISFGRYHYTLQESTLSSTSPHTEPRYHRRDEWQEIEFR